MLISTTYFAQVYLILEVFTLHHVGVDVASGFQIPFLYSDVTRHCLLRLRHYREAIGYALYKRFPDARSLIIVGETQRGFGGCIVTGWLPWNFGSFCFNCYVVGWSCGATAADAFLLCA